MYSIFPIIRYSILSKGGLGSGNFGHSGRPGKVGGSGPGGVSHKTILIMEKYKNEQADDKAIQEYMESMGLTLDDYNKVNKALYLHNVQSGEESDKRLLDLWNSDTSEGKAFRAMSRWNEWQVINTDWEKKDWNSARRIIRERPEGYKFFVGADSSGSLPRFKEYMLATEKGEAIFYRRGGLDHAALSTTTDRKGARSGSSLFHPNHWFSFNEMKSAGYHLVSGARGMVGVTSVQESEHIWLKPNK